jgi:hypothetical protein
MGGIIMDRIVHVCVRIEYCNGINSLTIQVVICEILGQKRAGDTSTDDGYLQPFPWFDARLTVELILGEYDVYEQVTPKME